MLGVTQAVHHDAILTIATAAKVSSKTWPRRDIKWSAFIEEFRIPRVTAETVAEFAAMTSQERTTAKDVGGFIGGLLKDDKRTKDSVVHRQLIALDLDNADDPTMLWELFCFRFKCAALLHSTHSSTLDKPRLRLLIPTKEPLTPAHYSLISRKLAEELGLSQFDESTFEANRLMFWPSVCKDGQTSYIFQYNDAPWLDTTPILADAKHDEAIEFMAKNDPGALPGTQGNFCRRYNVHQAIEQFLPDRYTPQGNNRYKLTGAMTGGGLCIYGDGKWCYSHHSSDPVRDIGTANAFDIVRVHKFGNKDAGQKKSTPVHALPSYEAMIEWIAENKLCEVLNWVDKLKVNKKGLPESTISNMHSIMVNDEAIAKKFHYDEFSHKLMVSGDFPWVGWMNRISLSWNDADDAGMRGFLEYKYAMSDISKVQDAITLASQDSKIHPIREYIKEQVWDNRPRAESLFIDFLGAEDTDYVRSVSRKALIGAVARVFQPGCKHDHVLVLVGPQGCRKSTTIKKLGRDWYSDSLYNMQGKEAYELLQGNWLIEISEMAAARKSDNEVIKQFLSKRSDNYRAAYARNTIDRPRQCAFFGSTNDQEFLKDPTGNRRFWPVQVSKVDILKYEELTDEYIDQVWAEVYQMYLKKEEWWLNEQDEEKAREVQERYTAVDNRTGLIEEFLNKHVDENHYDKPWQGYDESLPPSDKTKLRNRTCALELWQEVLNGQAKDFTQAKSREITELMRNMPGWKRVDKVYMGNRYGKVRGFIRE